MTLAKPFAHQHVVAQLVTVDQSTGEVSPASSGGGGGGDASAANQVTGNANTSAANTKLDTLHTDIVAGNTNGSPASVTGNITTQNLNPLTGVPTAASFQVLNTQGRDTVTIAITAAGTGSALSAQGSYDNATWFTLSNALGIGNWATGGVTGAVIPAATTGLFQVGLNGVPYFRVSTLAAVTGTWTVALYAVDGNSYVGFDQPLPPGANNIGTVTVGGASVGATNLAKAEDAVHASGDVGIEILGVQAPATPAALNAAGDYTPILTDGESKTLVTPYATATNQWQAAVTLTTLATPVAVKAAAAGGIRNYVTDITVSNSSATPTLVTIADNVTVIWQVWLPAGATVTKNFNVPLKGSAATALNANLTVSATSVYVSASGFLGI